MGVDSRGGGERVLALGGVEVWKNTWLTLAAHLVGRCFEPWISRGICLCVKDGL